jgi:hypothetical protein
MAATFGEVWTEWGVDEKGMHGPWMLVPSPGINAVILHDGKGLTVDDTQHQLVIEEALPVLGESRLGPIAELIPGVALAEMIASALVALLSGDRLFLVRGKRKGDTTIQAKDGRVVKASLSVSVKSPRPIKVAFNFVRHTVKSGGSTTIVNHTTRNPAEAAEWIKPLNRIFIPQANVVFKPSRPPNWVVVDRALTPTVTDSDWDDVIAKGHSSADWNVFLVKNYDHTLKEGTGGPWAGTAGKNTLCDDKQWLDNVVGNLAHEAGHMLIKLPGHPPCGRHCLMWPSAETRTGNKIPEEHVRSWFNPP